MLAGMETRFRWSPRYSTFWVGYLSRPSVCRLSEGAEAAQALCCAASHGAPGAGATDVAWIEGRPLRPATGHRFTLTFWGSAVAEAVFNVSLGRRLDLPTLPTGRNSSHTTWPSHCAGVLCWHAAVVIDWLPKFFSQSPVSVQNSIKPSKLPESIPPKRE